MASEQFNAILEALNNVYQARTYKIEVKLPLAEEVVMCAREVMWKLEGDRVVGREPGSFHASLIETLCRADPDNLHRAMYAFPAMTMVVRCYKQMPDGVELLRVIAAGLEDFPEQPAPGTPKGN